MKVTCGTCGADAHADCFEYVTDSKGPRRFYCTRCFRVRRRQAKKRQPGELEGGGK